MITINPNLYPSDGWWFRDANGTRHPVNGSASGLNALINSVADYRKRNGMPMGDPHTEVTVQICSRQPGLCRDSQQVSPPGPFIKADLGKKVLNWIQRMVGDKRAGNLRKISDQEALKRGEICARCPKQVGLPLTCGRCLDDIAKLRRALLDGKDPVHQGLGACSIFDDDLQTVIHFETGKAPNTDIPDYCWRKQK